jgi:hypothetical protein
VKSVNDTKIKSAVFGSHIGNCMKSLWFNLFLLVIVLIAIKIGPNEVAYGRRSALAKPWKLKVEL